MNTHTYMQLQIPCDCEVNIPAVDATVAVVKSGTIALRLMAKPLHYWSEGYPYTRKVCQLYAAISTCVREHSTIENLEVVGKVLLGTLSDNESEIGCVLWLLWLCSTVLNFDSGCLFKLVRTGYPVDWADKLCILWKLELPWQRRFDLNLTFIDTRRKSIIWKMHSETKSSPFKAFSLPCVCKVGGVKDLNSTQIPWRKNPSKYHHQAWITEFTDQGKMKVTMHVMYGKIQCLNMCIGFSCKIKLILLYIDM